MADDMWSWDKVKSGSSHMADSGYQYWKNLMNEYGSKPKSTNDKQGLFIFYVNVGQLSLQKANEHVTIFKHNNMETISKLEENYLIMFVPARDTAKTEFIKF